ELARPERQQVIREMTSESVANGVWGWVDDDLCFTSPWGFGVGEIEIPSRVVYGVDDVLVPRQHGEWLAENVPRAEVVIEHNQGPVPDPARVVERYPWLVGPPR